MSKKYAMAYEFVDRELIPIAGLPDDFDHHVLFWSAVEAGLILYDDGFDSVGRYYGLGQQGYTWAGPEVEDPESPEWAKLWGLIETMLEETPGA